MMKKLLVKKLAASTTSSKRGVVPSIFATRHANFNKTFSPILARNGMEERSIPSNFTTFPQQFRQFSSSAPRMEEAKAETQQAEAPKQAPQQQIPSAPKQPLTKRIAKFLFYLAAAGIVAAVALIKYFKLEELIPRDLFQSDGDYVLYTGKDVNKGRTFGDGIVRFIRSAYTVAWVCADYVITLRGLEGDERDKAKKECHQRSAARLVAAFIKNGGIYIKAGQTIASMNHVLPQEYVDAFSQCQDQCSRVGIEQVEQVFLDEFGYPIEHYFAEFDPVPIASASLAQVHRARLLTGEEVAVKVQYPGVRGRLVDDVMTIAFFVNIVTKVFPDFKFKWLLDEFEESLPKELDFICEAKNNERTKKNLKNRYDVTTPKIFWKLTTKRVLTMEFINGCKINDLAALSKMNVDPVDVSRILSEVFSEQMFIHGFVHCDPHPGNILVRSKKSGPELVLLDHGLYREITNEFRMDYCNLWKSVVMMEEENIMYYASKLGANEAYQLFASMLTSKEWDKNQKPGMVQEELTEDEKLRLKRMTFDNLGGIAEVLNNVPRQMLLLFKCNDLLRSVQYDLKVPIVYFSTMAKIAQHGINQYKMGVASSNVDTVQTIFRNAFDSVKLNMQLQAYSAALYFMLFMKQKFNYDVVRDNLLMNKMKIIYEQ